MFIPENEYFTDNFSDFKSRFAFIESVEEFIDRLKASLTAEEFGSLTIDLGDSESRINYGSGKINVLDVSWYARYKPYGDNVISAILWVTYLFAMYKQLPGIISGMSGTVSTGLHELSNYEHRH